MNESVQAQPIFAAAAACGVPHESLWRLFLRFLRFGCLAWGGPVAQIGMIRHELVEQERWIDRQHFNRALAVYQVLPGPEAHELCVYFGMLSRGRIGGLLAGLGFMLPGFLLVLLLSWTYLHYGLKNPVLLPVFASMQVAVAALVVRAAIRIGEHAIVNRTAALIALLVALAALMMQFGSPVPLAGAGARGLSAPPTALLLGAGLKAGLLTFGGAYTAIPLLQQDAVLSPHAWMSAAQFVDGVALSGLLPAPLIIFATFVGYMGGGLAGALLITLTVFAPAFSFTLFGHALFERVVHSHRVRRVLEAIMAAVVGLIGATAMGLTLAAVTSAPAVLLFVAALTVLLRTSSRWVIPVVIVGAAAWGLCAAAIQFV